MSEKGQKDITRQMFDVVKITAHRPLLELARAFLKQRTGPGYLLFHLVQQLLGSSNSRRREALGKLFIYRGEH
jgi:hypothetical protein